MSSMRSTSATSSAPQALDPSSHAAVLARQLIRHLGIDGATRTCRENHWDGVLSEVMNLARGDSAAR